MKNMEGEKFHRKKGVEKKRGEKMKEGREKRRERQSLYREKKI